MRYCKEYEPYHQSTYELGDLRYINVTMAKSWEKYGIHALETLYPIVGPGFTSIQNLGDKDRNIVHLYHSKGCLLYTSPSPRDVEESRMPSSA